MNIPKKSLGQNFLIDKNIIKKIIDLVEIKDKNIIEIGPGKGALTNEILKKSPKSLILIEKDNNLVKNLSSIYASNKKVKIHSEDILKFNLEKIIKKNSIIFGNLPYNISSQILVKIINFKGWPPKFNDLIFMFQKELGEKILGKYKSSNYGRLSILSNYRLKLFNKFLVTPTCFFPRPKIISMVIHFKPKYINNISIKNIKNLEKITNIFFSSKRKMINKTLNKIFLNRHIKLLPELDLKSRPSELKPEIYYKITNLYENL